MIAILQIILSVAIVTLILLQQRATGVSGFLGGDGGSGVYQTRRGIEKASFYSTIILSVLFVALALYQLINS
jgi:protein translocase SecG subunit